jgi:hypothetical protein
LHQGQVCGAGPNQRGKVRLHPSLARQAGHSFKLINNNEKQFLLHRIATAHDNKRQHPYEV